MRQLDGHSVHTMYETRRGYRLARRVGTWLHAPRAWLNEQLTTLRDGFRRGDSDGLLRAHEARFPQFAPASSVRSISDAGRGRTAS